MAFVISQQALTTIQIWNSLGRRSKLALAARDKREMADIFGDPRTVDRITSDAVLAMADRYALQTKGRI